MKQLSFNFSSCERCGKGPAEHRPAMTAYHWDGKGEDPNQDVMLCDECYDNHHAYWTSMWQDYYNGCM